MTRETPTTNLMDETGATQFALKHPGWAAVLGAALILLGIIAMIASATTTLATVLFFGILLLAAGMLQIADAIASRIYHGFEWRLLFGIVYAIVGALMVVDPVAGAIGLTLLLAMFFILAGVFRLVLASRLAGNLKGWLIASGGIALLLGILIAIGLPGTGTWLLGLFVGIEIVLSGVGLLLVASSAGSDVLST